MVALSGIDLAVVAVYLVAVVAFGLWVGRGERDATDYFLAGRALPWYLIGFSFYASNMSGASFVGLMGAAYSHGMVVFNYEWTATIVLIFFALFMLPVFLRSRLFTVPAYLETRFDRRARWAYAGFTILTLMFIDAAGALYAGGIVISTVWPEVDLWQTSAALALLAGVWAALALPPVHFTYMALLVFGLTLGVMLLVTFAGAPRLAPADACFQWADLKPETTAPKAAIFRDYRVQSAALALLMIAFIAAFW